MSHPQQRRIEIVRQAETQIDPEPVCDHSPFPRYTPGNYQARCVAAKIYRDPRFKRWTCRLEFRLVPSGEEACAFLNLGNGDKPHIGRGSEYRRAWIIANDDAPRTRQVMTKRVFVDKIFLVRIGDTNRRHDGREHPAGEVYSTVKEILKKMWP